MKSKMLGMLLLFLCFIISTSICVNAEYRATFAQNDADKANQINRDNEYPELLRKAEISIKQEASHGAYESIFNTNGYRRVVVEHVVDTLRHEGYHVWSSPDDTVLSISWEN